MTTILAVMDKDIRMLLIVSPFMFIPAHQRAKRMERLADPGIHDGVK